LILAEIEDGGVGGNEDVTQDVEGTNAWGEVEACKSGEAFGLSFGGHLQDVVFGGQYERVRIDDDGDVGKLVDDVTVGEDALAVDRDGTQFQVQIVDILFWSNNQGGARVSDGLASAGAPAERCVSELDVAQSKFPVGFRGERGVLEVASESG